MSFIHKVYVLIDKVPEFPYFILSSFFVFSMPIEVSRHVFAIAFLYMISSIFLGLAMKMVLKTKRPKPYGKIEPFCFDIPSLHTMVSIGAVAYVFFVDLYYSIVLFPICILYFISRLRLGYHTVNAVLIGAVSGVLVGCFFGLLLDTIFFDMMIESFLSVLFFIIPVFASLFRAFRNTAG